jgi:hypothetical protein
MAGHLSVSSLKELQKIKYKHNGMKTEIWILGIHVSDRINEANQVQSILTKFGCSIKTRLGLHDVRDDYCSASGMIILELTGDTSECQKLENELLKLENVQVKKMIFTQG